MAYYRRIRDMREDHDLTQRQLADLYKTSTDYLLNRTDDPTPPKAL